MLFILDAIECAVEEKVAFWKDERLIKRMKFIEEKEAVEENLDEKNRMADAPSDDFDEYLRECALSVLFPYGTPENLKEETQKELKAIMRSVADKLSEKDRKEIIGRLENENLNADISELLGTHDEGSC